MWMGIARIMYTENTSGDVLTVRGEGRRGEEEGRGHAEVRR